MYRPLQSSGQWARITDGEYKPIPAVTSPKVEAAKAAALGMNGLIVLASYDEGNPERMTVCVQFKPS